MQQAISAFRAGEQDAAVALFAQSLQLDPKNERAWIWLSGMFTHPSERRYCLERVLELNPNNAAAQQDLNQLPAAIAPSIPQALLPFMAAQQPERAPIHPAQQDDPIIGLPHPAPPAAPDNPTAPAATAEASVADEHDDLSWLHALEAQVKQTAPPLVPVLALGARRTPDAHSPGLAAQTLPPEPALAPAPAAAPPPAVASAREAQFPMRVELLPGKLHAQVFAHEINTANGLVPCWSYLSEGLWAAHGQPELLFTLRRELHERLDAFPSDPFDLFTRMFRRAARHQHVAVGDIFPFETTAFAAFQAGLLPVQPLEDVPLSAPTYTAVMLSGTEARAAEAFGLTRLLVRLGQAMQHYPYPPWSDRKRHSLLLDKAMQESVLVRTRRKHIAGASVRADANDTIVLTLTPEAGRKLAHELEQLGTNEGFAILTDLDAAADACLVWEPGSYESQSIQRIGSAGDSIGGCFLLFMPGQADNTGGIYEDGFTFLMNTAFWRLVRQAISSGEEVEVPTARGSFGFRLAWQHGFASGAAPEAASASTTAVPPKPMVATPPPALDVVELPPLFADVSPLPVPSFLEEAELLHARNASTIAQATDAAFYVEPPAWLVEPDDFVEPDDMQEALIVTPTPAPAVASALLIGDDTPLPPAVREAAPPAPPQPGPPAVEVREVSLLADEERLDNQIDRQALSAYIEHITSAVQNDMANHGHKTGRDLLVQCEIRPNGSVELSIAASPPLDASFARLEARLRALPVPAVTGESVGFQLMFALWGGDR
jgi:hypothetical protein